MLPKNAEFILNKLNENGYEAFLVGGCVRDKLLNKIPEDYDITTNALPKEIEQVFSDFRLNLKGLKHGTVGVIINGEMIEITTWMNGFLKSIDEAFGDRVWFVGLQGSYGRGEATEASDIDVVVILDELKKWLLIELLK